MKVLINAVSVKEGGSLVVLTRLLEQMNRLRSDIVWVVAVHSRASQGLQGVCQAEVLVCDWIDRSPLHLFWWYGVTLPRVLRRRQVDVLFSQTNYLPFLRAPCPSLLLEQHAGHFSHVFQRLATENARSRLAEWAWNLKGWWVRRSLKMATRVTVQTEALEGDILARLPSLSGGITVVPHGPGGVGIVQEPMEPRAGAPLRVGYISKIGVQKNFGVLFEAVQHLLDSGSSVELVLTLNETVPGFAVMRAEQERLGIVAAIDNRGEVSGEDLQALYDSLDVFVFPSLCESFGLPMVEAMARGIPLVVADTPVNTEVAGPGIPTFPAHDAQALAALLTALAGDPGRRRTLGRYGVERVRQRFTWRLAAERTLALIDSLAVSSN